MALKFVQTGLAGGTGGGGGTYDHSLLVNRGLPDQHTIESITGLRSALDKKYEKPFGGIPRTDLGFPVATLPDLELMRRTDLADLQTQINGIVAEIIEARGGLNRLKEYIDTKVPYSEYAGGGGSGSAGGSQVGYPIHETFIATEGQTRFVLPRKYRKGTKQLEVYLNGLRMVIDEDYVEVDDTTVDFLFPLEEEDVVLFQVRAVVNTGLHEEFIATENQTLFTLTNPYGINENTLQVFRNGNLLRKGKDYREVDEYNVEFMYPLIGGDYITFHQAGASDPAGSTLASDLDLARINIGYLTMLLQESTGSTMTDYAEMYVDIFATDANIDQAKSYPYALTAGNIEVREAILPINFDSGVTANVDIETFPGVVRLANLPGGYSSHSFGAATNLSTSGELIVDALVIESNRRTRYTAKIQNGGIGHKLVVVIQKRDGSTLTREIHETDGVFLSLEGETDKDGTLHLVYHEQGQSSGVPTVHYVRMKEDGTHDSKVLSNTMYEGTTPDLSLDQDSVVHVVFMSKRIDPGHFNIDYITVDSDLTLSGLKNLTTYTMYDAVNPRIVVGRDGKARVVFETIEYDGITKNLKMLIVENGYVSREKMVTTSTTFDNIKPDIGIAYDNSVRIAWMSRRLDTNFGIDFCSVGADEVVSSVKSVASGFPCGRPRLSMDEFDAAHIVFNGRHVLADTDNICYVLAQTASFVGPIEDIVQQAGSQYIDPNIRVYGPRVHVTYLTDILEGFHIEKSIESYNNSGTFEIVYDTKAEGSTIAEILADLDTPAGTMVDIQCRVSDDQVVWTDWKDYSDLLTTPATGRYVHLRATLSTSNSDVTPEIESLSVRYTPSYIWVQSVEKPATKDPDAAIVIAQYEGSVVFEVARDAQTFVTAVPDRPTDLLATPNGRKMVVRAKIERGSRLKGWGLIW